MPFNQAQIATPGNPTHPGGIATQSFSYGYTVLDPNTFFPECVNDPTETNCSYGTMLNNYEGGNVDLRVPYIGYSSESEAYTAAGIAMYNALETHLEQTVKPRHHSWSFLYLLARHRRTERHGTVLQRQQSRQSAQRIRLIRLRPHSRSEFHLRLHVPEIHERGYAGGQSGRRLGHSWHCGHSERPAVQHDRLFRSCRQHLLQHVQWNYQPDRAAGSRDAIARTR